MKKHIRRDDDFAITKKLRAQDVLKTREGYILVEDFIEENPVLLWSMIHKGKRSVTLVRPVYHALKEAVRKVAPHKVLAVEKKHRQYKTLKKFKEGKGNFTLIKKRLKGEDE